MFIILCILLLFVIYLVSWLILLTINYFLKNEYYDNSNMILTKAIAYIYYPYYHTLYWFIRKNGDLNRSDGTIYEEYSTYIKWMIDK